MSDITEKLKNADRLLKANDLVAKAIQNEDNPEVIRELIELSQSISDVHKRCIANVGRYSVDRDNAQSDVIKFDA